MCKFCEDNDDYYEGSLISPTVHLGFGGELCSWVFIEPDNKQLALHILNKDTGNQLEYYKGINFCPICGRDLNKEIK